jgi:hypothetical protein
MKRIICNRRLRLRKRGFGFEAFANRLRQTGPIEKVFDTARTLEPLEKYIVDPKGPHHRQPDAADRAGSSLVF